MSNSLRWVWVCAVLAALVLPISAAAQDENRLALRLAAGLVEPDDSGEVYLSGALRFRLGHGKGDAGDRRRQESAATKAAQRDDIVPWLEAEVGYWNIDDNGVYEASDTLVGLNLIGVVPARRADYYFGVGFGLHSIDLSYITLPQAGNLDDEVFGGNLQVGIELNLSDRIGIFGTARLDLLDHDLFSNQLKIYGGVSIGF